jgi:hypothetical protein
VVVGGRARDKAGGKTHSADKTISIDRAVLRRWRKLQNGEREFFSPTITQATTGSPSRTAGHRTPRRSDVRAPDSLLGFFLQTYAHVLKNDDRDAAEQAASFLIGDGWEAEPDDEQG